jgi:hypothetical protein
MFKRVTDPSILQRCLFHQTPFAGKRAGMASNPRHVYAGVRSTGRLAGPARARIPPPGAKGPDFGAKKKSNPATHISWEFGIGRDPAVRR